MKYRLPIMQRVPFIVRRPVMNRQPVVSRVSVFQRTPITSVEIPCNQCALCTGHTDCGGYAYLLPGDQVDLDEPKFGLVYYDGSTPVITDLEALESAHLYARMIADCPPPDEVLFALSYSPYNVIQFNYSNKYDSRAWSKAIHRAKSCGLYIAIKLPVIIPTVTRIQSVLAFMEDYHMVASFFAIQFLNTGAVMPTHDEAYFNVGGHVIPAKYFVENGKGGVQVSELFLTKFLTIMNQYTKPKKVNVMVCDNGKCY